MIEFLFERVVNAIVALNDESDRNFYWVAMKSFEVTLSADIFLILLENRPWKKLLIKLNCYFPYIFGVPVEDLSTVLCRMYVNSCQHAII